MNAMLHPVRQHVERPERTLTLLMVAKLRTSGREGLCRIRNVSTGGLRLETRMALGCGDPVCVEVRGRREVRGSVAWARDGRAGVSFDSEVALDALLAVAPQRPGRVLKAKIPRGPRLQVDCRVDVQLSSGRVEASLKDISQGGVKLTMSLVLQRDERVLLMLPGLPMKLGIVRWADAEVGIAFAEPLSFDVLAEWLLIREGPAMLSQQQPEKVYLSREEAAQ